MNTAVNTIEQNHGTAKTAIPSAAATTPSGHYRAFGPTLRPSRGAFKSDQDYRDAVRSWKDRWPNFNTEEESAAHLAWLESVAPRKTGGVK